MADLRMALEEAFKLNRDIERFLKFTTYPDYDDLSGLDIDFNDGEQLLIWEELRAITTGWRMCRTSSPTLPALSWK